MEKPSLTGVDSLFVPEMDKTSATPAFKMASRVFLHWSNLSVWT